MANFVTDGGTLPTNKVDAEAPGIPSTEFCDASDFNEVAQASLDIQAYLNFVTNLVTEGGDPTGSADSSAALTSACAAAATAGGVVYMQPGEYKIANNVTVPSGIVLAMDSGAVFVITSGKAITIYGSVVAGSQQIFSSTGSQPVIFYGPQQSMNVLWWGADPTGVSDSTLSIQQALSGQVGAYYEVVSDSQFVSAAPELFFPSGNFLITSSLLCNGGAIIRGNDTIITASTSGAGSTIDFFTGLGFQQRIRGITFVHGRHALSGSNDNNVGSVWIDDCVFLGQAGACLLTDENCANVAFHMSNCFMANYIQTTGTIVTSGSGVIYVSDCYGSAAGTSVFIVNGSPFQTTLFVTDCSFAPDTVGGQWADITVPGIITFERIRFGGEASEKSIVNWNAPIAAAELVPTVVDASFTCVDCDIYSDSGANTFSFYTLPMRIRISGNRGVLGNGIYFDAGIPYDQLHQIGNLFSLTTDTKLGGPKNEVINSSLPEAVDRLVAQGAGISVQPAAADLQVDITANDGAYVGVTINGGTGYGPTDPFGLTTEGYTATSSTNDLVLTYNELLAGLSAGPYTLVLDVAVNSQPANLLVNAGGCYPQNLVAPSGQSVLSIPFYKSFTDPSAWTTSHSYSTGNTVLSTNGNDIWIALNNGTSKSTGNGPLTGSPGSTFTDSGVTPITWEWIGTIGVAVSVYNIINGNHIAFSRVRIFSGHPTVQTQNSVVTGAAAPTSGSIQWIAGDIVWNTAPAAGGVIGWVCTTTGSPGTWKPFGLISA